VLLGHLPQEAEIRFPGGAGKPVRMIREISRYFAGEVRKGAARTRVPERKNALVLPDVESGVRMF